MPDSFEADTGHWLRSRWFSPSIQLLSNFRCLWVLDLHALELRTLSSSIANTLENLTLSWTPIRALPDSITELKNLQILALYTCTKLRKLPTNIRKLTNLRSLDIVQCRPLTYMPPGIGDNFLLNSSHSSDCRHEPSTAQLRELKNLSKLRGALQIKILGELKDPAYYEAKEANLGSKHGLIELSMEGNASLYGAVSGK
ncbi:LOW QUALITY PROTEIN: hypothetical protein Cgig2_024319 [Carnegiea gigantea]|uniref:Disease resistance R13L4/SHOC-2-like LRR domain-containing protein n=1 Tax=Carnegiea gigantea TaxID=171969 RepID=A0A9Q1K2R4_9CARY|nr:LOW QUALITY PROTEIN: hypothetical protein Cgig2_024319 [Carnegiea gigantea]